MRDLTVKNLTVNLGGSKILRDLSVRFESGQLIALAGPNGSGKSTLIRALTGVNALSRNDISTGGVDLSEMRPRQRAQIIGYLPQLRDMVWDIPVCDLVSLGRFAYGSRTYQTLSETDRDAVDEALKAMSLDQLSNRSLSTLSGGELARVHFARVLAAQTPILLADEPTASLDLRHQHDVMTCLKSRAEAGALVIAALHDLDAARRWADRIIILDHGDIAADGDPKAVIDDGIMQSVFGMRSGKDGLIPA